MIFNIVVTIVKPPLYQSFIINCFFLTYNVISFLLCYGYKLKNIFQKIGTKNVLFTQKGI